MTDTKAPKRIWAWPDANDHFNPAKPDWGSGHWDCDGGSQSEAYVRSDLLTALKEENERLARIVLAAEELAEAIEYEFHTFKQKWGDDCQIITAAIAYRKAVEGWE